MIYQVEDVHFCYPNTTRTILDGVSLNLEQGEVLSILGPNGAGKSTLLNCMANLLQPDSGVVKLCDKDVREMTHKEIANRISYVQQTQTPAFAYSVFTFVMMGRAAKVGMFQKPKAADEAAVWEALDTMDIAHLAAKAYTEISGGECQQVTIARAIAQEPKAILFDEPTSHLDYGNQLKILRLIKRMSQKGYSVILTTHNPDHAILLGGKAAILDRAGHLTYGDSREIITEDCLQEVYQAQLRLLYVEELSRVACLPPKL